jgi:nucleotide-binding universal stress UspA family protein
MNAAANAYDNVLVPLDGSKFSERALGPAGAIAEATGATLHLVSVPEVYGIDTAWYAEAATPGSALAVPIEELMQEARESTRQYLEEQARALAAQGIRVETHVGGLEPAEAILAASTAAEADLVVMATHGRGGVTRWAFGSVAEHVLHHGQVPLLLVRVAEERAEPVFRNILVALDGSDLAERVLNDVIPLAKALGTTVTLVNVTREPESVPLPPPLMRAYAERLDEMRAYLSRKVAELRAAGIDADGEELTHGSVAEALLEREAQGDVDLVAMTTHGRTGVRRATLGSVADRVVRNGEIPVLIRRVV